MNTHIKIVAGKLFLALIALGHQSASAIPNHVPVHSGFGVNPVVIETGITVISLLCILLLYQFWRFYQRAKSREAEIRQQIWRQANYDYLTQLPNRYLLQSCLEEAILECSQSGQQLGLLLIDLDGFKDVNDVAGHAIGDRLLQNAALRIQSCARNGDTTAKLGGDEFVVVVPKLRNLKELHQIGSKIVDSIRAPFHIEDNQYFVTASIGIAAFPDHSTSGEELMMFADQALYAAKRAGKNQYQFFTQAMQREIRERILLTHDLRSAVANGELHLVYQPIFRLRDLGLIKAEALIRWQHPQHGVVPPNKFIGVAELTGLIVPMGAWVLKVACQQVAAWKTGDLSQVKVSVNVSPMQLRSPGFTDYVLQVLRETGLSADRLVIELTESALVHSDCKGTESLQALKQLGVKLAIDDFGTGYSCLAYLRDIPGDYLKVDRSFVNDVPGKERSEAVTSAIVVLGKNLHYQIVAEGVETQAQADYLKSLGCDLVQGFLYARPMEEKALQEWVNNAT